MRLRRVASKALGSCTFVWISCALVACTEVCPTGTTERQEHCIPNSKLVDAEVVTADGQASTGSAGTSALNPGAAGGAAASANSGEAGGGGDPGSVARSQAGASASGSSSDPSVDAGISEQAKAMGNPDASTAGSYCGNGTVDPGETCDGNCPNASACESTNPCVMTRLEGDPAKCTAQCAMVKVTQCASGDGCCAENCRYPEDDDCSQSCGDGFVSTPKETCEPTSVETPCPTTCDDGVPCTRDVLSGKPEQCNVACTHTPITRTGPSSCDDRNPCTRDMRVESETSCEYECVNTPMTRTGPSSCDDGDPCTRDMRAESATSCEYECVNTPMTRTRPASCNDNDPCTQDDMVASTTRCTYECVNTRMQRTGPSACNDGNSCTRDERVPSQTACVFECDYREITAPSSGDGCCPINVSASADRDCPAVCGDGAVTGSERCDPMSTANPCPNDSSQCPPAPASEVQRCAADKSCGGTGCLPAASLAGTGCQKYCTWICIGAA